VWNAPLTNNAPLDPTSPTAVANLVHQASVESLGLGAYGGPTPYISGPTRRRFTSRWTSTTPELQAALNVVPIPLAARPSVGTDAVMLIYQPSTDTMWELWKAVKQADGWHASWGGRMTRFYANPPSPM
jgi:hypothetical protein